MSLSLYEWVCKVDCDILVSYDLDAYVSTDNDVTAETQTEEGTAVEVKIKETHEPEEEEDHDQETEVAIPTLSEALEAFKTVNLFYEARSKDTTIISEIGNTEDDLEKQYCTK
jgi:hypothetical protein